MKQGDIIKLDLSPTKGHEQSGYRPVMVVSNSNFNRVTNLILVCPITSTVNNFPLHVKLDLSMQTKGVVKCEQVKAVDTTARPYTVIESAPKNIVNEVIDIIYGSIEVLDNA